jgi:hypothetical protein
MTEYLPAVPLLWAQEAAVHVADNGPPVAWMSLLGAMVLAIPLVAIVLGLRHARYEREVEHLERMKALELGRTLPGDAPFWSPNRLCAAMGLALPLALFVLSFAFSRFMDRGEEAAWVFGAATAIVGMLCGTALAIFLPRREAATAPSFIKPTLDPDALDTAPRRGWPEEHPVAGGRP